ncbi:MAG: 6-bladed beta-propeller [Candidatus Aminicenantes bacterium]|nr:6-bladed beta-propeller [Candidatus Aminicenantes bacterium]
MKKYIFLYVLSSMTIWGASTIFADSEKKATPENQELWSFSYFGQEDYFHRPSDMAYDTARSLIYIADGGNNRILIFETNGQFVRAIGKKGQGPGEFSRPTGLCLMKDSRLAVADYGNNRIQIFGPEGEHDKVINTRELHVADLLVIGKEIFTIPSYGISGYSLNMQLKENSQPLVNVLDFEGNVVRTITTDAYPETHPFIRAIKHRVSMAFSPEGNLFLPFFAINNVSVFSPDGKKIEEFERPIPFKPLFPELLRQTTSKDRIAMAAKVDMVNHSAHIGEDGHLYILTFVESFDKLIKKRKKTEEMPPIPMRVDVLDSTSYKTLRSIEMDSNVRAFTPLEKNRLAYIYEDAEGELVFKGIYLKQ